MDRMTYTHPHNGQFWRFANLLGKGVFYVYTPPIQWCAQHFLVDTDCAVHTTKGVARESRNQLADFFSGSPDGKGVVYVVKVSTRG